MSARVRMIACAVAFATTTSLGAAQAQLSQALAWCGASEADGFSLDQQISGCTTVIQSGSNLARAFNNRGLAYHAKGQHDHTIQDYDEAVRLDPSAAIAYCNRGLACRAKGLHDRAIQDFDQAIKLDPRLAIPFATRHAQKIE